MLGFFRRKKKVKGTFIITQYSIMTLDSEEGFGRAVRIQEKFCEMITNTPFPAGLIVMGNRLVFCATTDAVEGVIYDGRKPRLITGTATEFLSM